MIELINHIALTLGVSAGPAEIISLGSTAMIIALGCWLSFIITKKFLLRLLFNLVKRSKFKWSEIFFSDVLLNRLSHFAPPMLFHALAFNFPDYQIMLQRFAYVYMILVGMTLVQPVTASVDKIYKRTVKSHRQRPITGYLELFQIFLYIIAIILMISVVINRSPAQLLAGIGALTAVLLLIFRDTLLGFVAATKVASADMVRIGDWIEMPKYGADGEVTEINLTAIKVQNWDKTITTIPTYLLVSDSFKNWRSMEEAGGRRIKRAVYIDMTSIRFCDDRLLKKLEQLHLLKQYIVDKRQEIEVYNKKKKIDASILVNGRRMTNIGVFRAYLAAYLKEHPKIHNDMTFLIRHLPPCEKGLPIEIYVFSNDTQWANYEDIQADIFDHVLASLSEFGLRVFQNPSGHDFRGLKS